LRAWAHEAAPVVLDIETRLAEQSELKLTEEMLKEQDDTILDYKLLASAGPVMSQRVFVLPSNTVVKTMPASLLIMRTHTSRHIFLLAVGPEKELNMLATDLSVLKGRELNTPKWLEGGHDEALAQIHDHLAELETGLARLNKNLSSLIEKHKLAKALADMRRMDWLMTHVKTLPVSENFAWVTGWTNDLDGEQIRASLANEDIHFILHYPDAPQDSHAPMVMNNPWWAQPFELFAGLLGTPSRDEADPSRVLALIVPLLFGYMFGDVGQGLVILLAGIVLQRRWPIAKLLIAYGIAAMIFGFIFGSVFGSENLISPLWLHPIDQPLPVLMVPLAGGIIVLLLGLLLNMAECWWRGEITRWLQIEAAILVLYVSLIASYFSSNSLYISMLALAWYFIGSVMQSPQHPLKTLAASAGNLLENIFQLFINTISFVRVGAFALAHAGLSLAFYTMAATTNSIIISLLILLIGNIIIIFLEGLVVTIQTTRLILFEFFIRFMHGTGRMFRPLAAPTEPSQIRRTS
ncbi:MAG: ATPase, partial [Gammaproteobacteria bacterium]|nr:ATPase [Gammaproteobacteria bacterium]